MPAPNRPAPIRTETTAIAVPKGIVGYYTDLEVDELLAALPTGGGPAPDLSAYATTAYVDGIAATVYTKAEVDAAIAAAATGDVDLSAYATSEYVNGLVTPFVNELATIKDDFGLVNNQVQALATVSQNVMDAVELKADKTAVATLSTTLMDSILEVKAGSYTKAETDALLAALPAGEVGPITVHEGAPPQPAAPTPAALEAAFDGLEDGLHYFKGIGALVTVTRQQWQTTVIVNGSVRSVARIVKSQAGLPTPENPSMLLQCEADGRWLRMSSAELAVPFGPPEAVDPFTLPTKQEVDAAIAAAVSGGLTQEQIDAVLSQIGPVDLSAYAKLDNFAQDITANLMKAQGFVFTKSNTSLGFARFPEYPNGKLGIEIGGPGGEVQFVAYVSELGDYAKKQDNTQNLLAKVVTAQGYGFGEAGEPPVALTYTDTGAGFGDRLVFATPDAIEYLVYASDLAAVKTRVEALEGKSAPALDLSSYVTLIDADARYGSHEAVKLLQSQLQTVFDSLYTRAESDARYYTQKQTDDRFMRIDQAFSKADFDNQLALFLYSRKQVDDKLAAISPLGSPSINDPALADFKKSVLDAVALMLAGGGKQPPADIGWTKCRTAAGTADSVLEVRMIAGVMEFKGTLNTGSISGSQNICQLPASFPLPELTASYPIAARLVGSNAVYTYVNFNSTNRTVGVTMASTISEVTLSGLRVKAAY